MFDRLLEATDLMDWECSSGNVSKNARFIDTFY